MNRDETSQRHKPLDQDLIRSWQVQTSAKFHDEVDLVIVACTRQHGLISRIQKSNEADLGLIKGSSLRFVPCLLVTVNGFVLFQPSLKFFGDSAKDSWSIRSQNLSSLCE